MTNKIKDAVYAQRYVYNCHYHLIWCTKYRNQIFTTKELADEMKKLITDTAKNNDIIIEKLEVMPEHVHAMISFRPSKSISDVVKALKGHTGYIFLRNHPDIREKKCWGGHLWSSSYYIGTVGNMSKDTVERYINDQTYNAKKDGKPGNPPIKIGGFPGLPSIDKIIKKFSLARHTQLTGLTYTTNWFGIHN